MTKDVTIAYQNLSFNPVQLKKSLDTKLEITLTPVDAKVLNEETFNAAKRDGNYEKKMSMMVERRKVEMNGLSKTDRKILEARIKAYNLLNNLIGRGEIKQDIGIELQSRVLYGRESGKEGTEIEFLSLINNFRDDYNPFKVNEKYLSVFKIVFENKGKDVEKINVKNFQVVSGEEQLYPLGNDYFENIFKSDPDKLQNINRLNMPSELILTPGQRISKYLAVPAINPANNKLSIQYIKNNDVLGYDFEVQEISSKKVYNLESYYIDAKTWQDMTNFEVFYLVQLSENKYFPTNSDRFFVSETDKKGSVSVYAIAIDYTNGTIYFSKKMNLIFSELKNNTISININ